MTAVADAAARALISADGLDRTLFVEAGAGTGKTTQLVQRIVNLVITQGLRLADVAAITFTEAAATELQDRVRVAFEDLATMTTDAATRERCLQAITDADLAAITTLHGFAKRILTEHAVAAGLPVRIDIADEVTSQLAHEQRWSRFMDRLYDDPAREELLVRASLLGIALEPQYPGQPSLKEVASTLAQNWDRLAAVAARSVEPLPSIDLAPLRAAVDELAIAAKRCTDPEDLLSVRLAALVPQMRAVLDHDDPRWALRDLTGPLVKRWGPGSGGRAAAWGCDPAEIKGLVRQVTTAAADVVAAASDEVLTRLLTLVSREVLDAAQDRRGEGRLEFHDLLVLARQLLRTSPEARRRLHVRYRCLLLDEFQDTDPIQIELAVLIAATVDHDHPAGWRDLDVAEGRLFFVGDPKQSIYRFRRADIGLFLEARDRFAPGRSWQRLVTNFRTVAPVVDWNNALFSALMPAELPGLQPAYEALVAQRSGPPGADHRPVLLAPPVPASAKLDAAGLRSAEAADVAAAIDAIRHDPGRWAVQDRATGRWRPARLPDITVLVPTRTSLPFLRQALTARDIPHRLDTGTLVYTAQEVRDLLASLRAVDDPTDEVSLVAALRSPLYACTDLDLHQWRQGGGRWDLRRPVPEAIDPAHPVAMAVAHLRSVWRDRWWATPSELLGRLLRERRADLLAVGHDRPAEVWRRLRFLLDQARAFEEAGGGPLRAFLEWADLQASETARVHEPLLAETDDHAVRIMTVHGSKGLEFPITILSGMTTRPSTPRNGYRLVWRDDDIPEVSVNARVATAHHDPRADLEDQMDQHEKLRLLYVACTRARDHLLVATRHNEGDRSYACLVWEHSQAHPERWRSLEPQDRSEPAPRQEVLPLEPPAADDRDGWVAAREALLGPQRSPTFVSATAVATEAGGSAAAGATAEEPGDDLGDDDDDGGPSPSRRRGRTGTAIGRAVHATLEVLDLARPGDVEAQAARQAELEAVPAAAPTVAALVRSALAAPVIRRAAWVRHHKEVYVAAPVGGRVLEGFIDLLLETPEGLVVVDYKTDAVRSDADVDATVARYELQAAAYALVLEEATGSAVVDCRLVFCRVGGAIERSVPDLAAAKARVRRHVSGSIGGSGADPASMGT